MKRSKNYTAEQIEFLQVGYQSMNARDLAGAFNEKFGCQKTEGMIVSTLKNHGIKCGRKQKDRFINRLRLYTPEQAQFLRENYSGRSVRDLTDLFNSRFETIYTEKQIKSFVHNRGITSGRTGHFEKGHSPWNSNTKGLGVTTANKTSFKKGNAPSNRKPLYSERIDGKDGYIQIKIPEQNPYTGFSTRYKAKHVYLWEQANGPVPDGMVVIFKDGEQLHCELENLVMVSRAELLELNHNRYKVQPDDLKPSVFALSKLKVKVSSISKNKRGKRSTSCE